MEKISLKDYAARTGFSYGYLLRKISEQGEQKELEGVSKFERFGKNWLLSIDGRCMPEKRISKKSLK